jgi:hypothetical protein
VAALTIDVGWQGGAIAPVDIRAELPQASRALQGRTPAEAVALLGRLYSVCGHAQRAAAELALAAASARPLAADRHVALEAAVARECAVEHLWRLLVDWPRKLGIAGAPDRFAAWYRRIVGADDAWAAELSAELNDWLGVSAERLEDWRTTAPHDAWLAAAASPFARTFAALRAAELAASSGEAGAVAGPTGAPADETGAFVQHRDHAWLAMLDAAGRGLEARLAARAVALVRLTASLAAPERADVEVELDACAPCAGGGRAVVATARGVLVHDVSIAADRIERYAIRTPTECNFAAQGAYRALVASRRARDAAGAERLADLWALALDPCVPYTVRGPGAATATIESAGSAVHA